MSEEGKTGIITSMYDLGYKEGYEKAKNETPSTELLLKIFWMFDKHGLIKDDLCFDPEHFMETVIREHWKDNKQEK